MATCHLSLSYFSLSRKSLLSCCCSILHSCDANGGVDGRMSWFVQSAWLALDPSDGITRGVQMIEVRQMQLASVCLDSPWAHGNDLCLVGIYFVMNHIII